MPSTGNIIIDLMVIAIISLSSALIFLFKKLLNLQESRIRFIITQLEQQQKITSISYSKGHSHETS